MNDKNKTKWLKKIGRGYTVEETINTNYFGPRRVNDAFIKLLNNPGGRIVNVASASGPNFLKTFSDEDGLKQQLMKPWLLPNGIDDIDKIAKSLSTSKVEGYGASKALLNAYTAVPSFGQSV